MIKENKKISIIIPTKNEEKTLPLLLNSLEAQTIKGFNIIVGDANSKDRTREIAKKYHSIVVEGGMPSYGRNKGAEKAISENSELLIFMDSDLILPSENFLEKAISEFYLRNLDLAGTIQVPLDLNIQISETNAIASCKKSNHLGYLISYNLSNFGMKILQNTKSPFMQNCMFAKPEVHKKINGFQPLEFGEDSKYSKDAVSKGFKFGILSTPGKIYISPRRLRDKGFLKMLGDYTYFNGARLFGYEFIEGKSRKYFDD